MYAPTAANMCKYFVEHSKTLKEKNYNLRVGDLEFEVVPENNGRYKNIYHVEMFGGYSFRSFESDGSYYLYDTWAKRDAEEDSDSKTLSGNSIRYSATIEYKYDSNDSCVWGRPIK